MPRLPSPTVRLRLTLLYGALFLVSGTVLLAITYVLFRGSGGTSLIIPTGAANEPTGPAALRRLLANPHVANYIRHYSEAKFAKVEAAHTEELHQLLVQSGIALGIMTVVSIAVGWLVAGRVLRPLRTMTATTRQISERNLNERLALRGPDDELKDLADTIDALLASLETHVAEQQRFAANASHELRTPLATTQTLLDVARNDPDRDANELVERLHAVNTRAIDLTEALLLLSRADQRPPQEHVDLSLLAEEAAETLLPLAETRGIAIEASGEVAPTIGSHALLLQLTTNLLHNAIVHNLPAQGTVWITTGVDPEGAALTVENTGPELAPDSVPTLTEPFLRGTERVRTDHTGVGLGLAIVSSIAAAHEGTLTLTPRPAGGLRVTVRLPAAPDRVDFDPARSSPW